MEYVPKEFDVTAAEDRIDKLGYGLIRTHDCVQRLKKVRILGTMQYVTNLAHNYNRYEHSLTVATFAHEYALRWGLPEEWQRLVVLIALLHDIGHLPFSHGSEVFYRDLWGKYHTGQSARLTAHLIKALKIRGNKETAEEVQRASNFITERQDWQKSIEGRLVHEIFHGVLSADTLDGITRAAESIGLELPRVREIIESTFRNGNSILVQGEAWRLIGQFLDLKYKIYHDYIYCSKGIAAEAMLTRALELAFEGVTGENEFLSLDDDDTLERLRSNMPARRILERLESRDLFVSLDDVQSDKHALFASLYDRMSRDAKWSRSVRKELERQLASQMGLDDPASFVIHPMIRLNIEKFVITPMLLPNIPYSLAEIARSFRTPKSYGDTIGILFPSEHSKNTRYLRLPDQKNVLENATNVSGTVPKVDYVDKHMGAYMTPPAIANFMTDWAIRDKNARVLDPASGDGIFLKAVFKRLRRLGASSKRGAAFLYGIEADGTRRADSLCDWPDNVKPLEGNVYHDDFFSVMRRDRNRLDDLDAVIGNPPYVRSHRLSQKTIDEGINLAKEVANVTLLRNSGSWAAYVVCSVMLLKPSGRFAMVLPVELLSTAYAQPVREFLERRFSALTFILFEKAVFGPVQQDVVLLLASNDPPAGMTRLEVCDAKELSDASVDDAAPVPSTKGWLSGRWTHLITNPTTVALLNELLERDSICLLGDQAEIRLGQVTGDNDFFLFDTRMVEEHQIDKRWLRPMVSRASAIPGTVLTMADRQRMEENNERCFILAISSTDNVNKDKSLLGYLEKGKRRGVDEGYKCRTRWPWYSVPMQPPPDAFLTYMSGERVRLVLNRASVNSTNTIHNVTFKRKLLRAATVAAFYSSLTSLSTELIGRAYGGGVLKLELQEARRIILPKVDALTREDIVELRKSLPVLDKAVRSADQKGQQIIDEIILGKALKLSRLDAEKIISERLRLTSRRMTRFR